jgi:SAM-dependent methyltransferase
MSEKQSQSTVSQHYGGEGATEYFDYQVTDVRRNNWVSMRFFASFLSPTDDVVDYGCGTGWLLKQLDVGSRLGVEPNPNSRGVAAEIGVPTVAASSDVPDASADVVISNHALEHSLDPLRELKEIRRIVRSGGKVVICLPIDDWRKQKGPDPSDPNHHLFTWTPLLISNLLGEAGLNVLEARGFSYLQPPPNWRLDWLPVPLFNAVAKLHGKFFRYHQLVAVAEPV